MGLCWLADLALFALAVQWLDIVIAQLVARLTGALLGFLLHKFVTFNEPDTRASGAALRYLALWVFSYVASTSLILLLVHVQLTAVAAKLIAEIVLVPLNFFLMRRFVFLRPG